MSTRWDLPALREGALVALVFAVPFSVASRLVHDDNPDSTLVVPLLLAAVIGFVLGAGVAAWRQRTSTPLSHGIVAAVGTYTVVQGVLVTIKLIRGAEIHWFAIVFNLTVTLAAGCVGGLLGMALQRLGLEPRR